MKSIFNLDGKVALVTGGGSGLGASIALTLSKSGAKVALAARRKDKLRETEDLIKESGGICLLYTSPSPRDLSTSRMPSSA